VRFDRSATWTRAIRIRIHSNRATVFNLVAEVELWPALFRHIHSARVLRRDGRRRLIAVSANWRGFPFGYTAIQTVDRDEWRTEIRHISPLTRGSIATFGVIPVSSLDPPGEVVDVELHQQVIVPVPAVGGLLARRFIGEHVVRDLGQSMLVRLKEVAEGGSLSGRS
jgi:Polyketide cyclase / dehydrase and lipid transport